MGLFAPFVFLVDLCVLASSRDHQDRGARNSLRCLCHDRYDALADLPRVDGKPVEFDRVGQADAGQDQFPEGIDLGCGSLHGADLDGDPDAADFRRDAHLGDRARMESIVAPHFYLWVDDCGVRDRDGSRARRRVVR